MNKIMVTCKLHKASKYCRTYAHGDCLNCENSNHNCEHDFKHTGTSGNVYEGGSTYSKCSKCGIYRSQSEDGTQYYPSSYKPYYRTILDDLKDAHVDPNDDLAVERFLGSNQ